MWSTLTMPSLSKFCTLGFFLCSALAQAEGIYYDVHVFRCNDTQYIGAIESYLIGIRHNPNTKHHLTEICDAQLLLGLKELGVGMRREAKFEAARLKCREDNSEMVKQCNDELSKACQVDPKTSVIGNMNCWHKQP
jgi:hypothetical protein